MKIFFILVWQVFVTRPAPCPGYGKSYDEFGNRINSGMTCLVIHSKVEKVAESFRVFESTESVNAFIDGMNGNKVYGYPFSTDSKSINFELYRSTTTFSSFDDVISSDWKEKIK